MEPNNPKKIQFAVPPHQKQLDPQAAEQIRRRRPTPASLVVYANPEAAGKGCQSEFSPQEPQMSAARLVPLTFQGRRLLKTLEYAH
nr:protein phosphatase 1 regulatory subunit 1C-like [Paramormyrops kingsleyae]